MNPACFAALLVTLTFSNLMTNWKFSGNKKGIARPMHRQCRPGMLKTAATAIESKPKVFGNQFINSTSDTNEQQKIFINLL